MLMILLSQLGAESVDRNSTLQTEQNAALIDANDHITTNITA